MSQTFSNGDARARAAELTQLLKDGRLDLAVVDDDGNTPLWRAVFHAPGTGTVINVLLEHGAEQSPREPDRSGPQDDRRRRNRRPAAAPAGGRGKILNGNAESFAGRTIAGWPPGRTSPASSLSYR